MNLPKFSVLLLILSAACILDVYAGEKTVVVLDRLDRPIAGAKVVLFYPDEERHDEFRTNERGEAPVVLRTDAAFGGIVVLVGEEIHEGEIEWVEIKGSEFPDPKKGTTWPVTFRMEEIPPIVETVIVVDRFDRPVPGAAVYMSYNDAGRAPKFLTNERGEASVVVKPKAGLVQIIAVMGEEKQGVNPPDPEKGTTWPVTIRMNIPQERSKNAQSWSRALDWLRAKVRKNAGK